MTEEITGNDDPNATMLNYHSVSDINVMYNVGPIVISWFQTPSYYCYIDTNPSYCSYKTT